MKAEEEPLMELAALHGVHTAYTDVDGVRRPADPTVVFALLQALGVPLEHPRDAEAVLRDLRIGAVRRRLEPVLVHRIGRHEPVWATLPTDTDPGDVWLSLELEDGATSRCRLAAAVTGLDDEEVEGGRHVRVQFDLDVVADRLVPPGYHHLTLEGVEAPESALVLSAPDCPDGPHRWGAFLPLHALRTEHDAGTGTYTDLGRLGDWVAALGGGLVGTLPLYPAFLDPPADPSPYLPVSKLAYNELFIDATALPEYGATAEARAAGASGREERLAALRASPLVEYEELARLTRTVLEPMAHAACSGALPGRREALHEFVARHPELLGYARFRAGLEDSARHHEPDPAAVGYHLYCQWAACQQLTGTGHHVGRYADLPVGSHPGGFDPVWAPESFVPRVHGGAPPDRFFARGQDWGFRPLHPQRMREDGYRFFAAVLRRAFRHADCLRIDHVMGLQRMYMIPEGHPASEGAYVSYRAAELHALVALEAHRAGAVVVGEDLGTVPGGVRRRMAQDRMLRTWVFQFESTPQQPLPDPPANTLASLGTHDLPRFGAYLWGEDIAERESTGVLSPMQAEAERTTRTLWRRRLLDELQVASEGATEDQITARALMGCLLHLARSDAQIVLVDLEEMWDERQPQNRPGTTEGNWRRRSARTLEDFTTDQALVQSLSGLTAERGS